ncbi:uncharacterized protein EDB91DRAFT_457841 [Suillus paluster]|uniref:uncharacterized protein n=1 Tax=Suillus paluster TaxID=48578 RepID=UPI001B8775C6|nr:uncharacterized protein EDB91DRAFT_457841 [Suillus paluster]KAG1738388.1 hypothetical protein EDB91DRAFT_457841 [Suillus paluster]
MVQYPDEKSNNPYTNWVQPPDPAAQQQQNQYQAPLGPPPAYTQESPYTPRDAYQGHIPQSQVSQPQTYQAPLVSGSLLPSGHQAPSAGYNDQKGGEYLSHQQGAPGARSPYDQNRAGPSGYPLYQLNNSLSPYSQNPGAVPQDRAPSPSGGAEGLSLASFFGNTGTPPMWERRPPQHLPYSQFPPMCLISKDKDLSKGFPELPPPCQAHPHPFATHDITEEDWIRFLADVKKGGSLSGGQRIKSNVIPLMVGASLVGGLFLTSAIERRMKAKNRNAAGDIIDHWNYYFFGPRRMEAVLCQASERLSGREGAAPFGDASQRHMTNDRRRRTSSCSSSSSSSSSSDSEDCRSRHGHGHGRAPLVSYKSDKRQRRAEKREARAERRQEKRARKAERRSGKARGDHLQPYQLFIQPI